MKASRYAVVAFPKLDTGTDIQRVRERSGVHAFQVQPHVPLVSPFTPANLDELLSITEYISRVRRNLRPIAVAFRGCVERGDYVVSPCTEGVDDLNGLHKNLLGGEPASLLPDTEAFEPVLVLGRVPDPAQRSGFMLESDRTGRHLALIDALTLVRVEPEAMWRQVAMFPFGIGRVDFYEKIIP